jgi:hypothetical protein
MDGKERNRKKYDRLLQRYKDDPEFEKQHKNRKLYLQRIRYHRPEVREKHRLACIVSKQKRLRGNVLEGCALIVAAPVVVAFD